MYPRAGDEPGGMLRERCKFELIAGPCSPGSVRAIHARSMGVPRETLTLAAHCYELAMEQREKITPVMVEQVGASMEVRDGEA